jgi:hypothetical protein
MTTRRSFLAASAALTAAGATAFAATAGAAADPAFAAIERYRSANAAYIAALIRAEQVASKTPAERRRWSPSVTERAVPDGCTDDPEHIAAELAAFEFADDDSRAVIALVSTRPTTLAGLAAVVAFIRDQENAGNNLLTNIHTGGYDSETGGALYCDTSLALVEMCADALQAIMREQDMQGRAGQ